MNDSILIGISLSNTRFEYYPNWILGNDLHIRVVLLAADLASQNLLATCDALVLTGGTDLHPSTYNSSQLRYPNAPVLGWDEMRDHFEQDLFRQALIEKIPILAICRGMQLVNVTLGGTLIPDLEENGKNNHRRTESGDGEHLIQILPKTQLSALAEVEDMFINSAHHQSVDLLADDLIISAMSPDGVIEAVEWKIAAIHPPMLAVQWHPERMGNSPNEDNLSKKLRNWILQQAKIFHESKQERKSLFQ